MERYGGKPLTDEQKEDLAAQKNHIYRKLLDNMQSTDVSDEIRNTLKKLHSLGYQLAVGSSSRNAKFILERADLMEYFDAISCGLDVTKSKPDPEVFLVAAKKLGLDPKDCVVIEDSDAGIEAAKAGNMYAVAVGAAIDNPKADYKATGLDTFDYQNCKLFN